METTGPRTHPSCRELLLTLPFVLLLPLFFLPQRARAQDQKESEEKTLQTVTIRGAVKALENQSGIAGATLTVFTLANNTLDEEVLKVESDPEGGFEIPDLAVNRYGLRTDSEGRAPDLRLLVASKEVADGDPLTIELARAFAITGQIVDRTTGAGIPEVRVSITEGSFPSQTDESGHFNLENQPQGRDEYVLNLQLKGYVPQSLTFDTMNFPVHSGVKVELDRGITTKYTVVDPEGRPIEDAEVALRFYREDPYSPFRSFFQSRTDKAGVCQVSGLNQSTPFVAMVRKEGYPPHQSDAMWLGQGAIQQTLVISNNAYIAGKVIDESGLPVAAAKVSVERIVQPLLSFGGPDPGRKDKGFLTVATNEEGTFNLKGVAYGKHRVRVDSPGHEIYEALCKTSIKQDDPPLILTLKHRKDSPRPHSTDVPGIAWESHQDIAFDRAKREQRPVFLAMAMDDEPANDGIAVIHFVNPELIELTRYTCPILSTAFDHTPEEDPTAVDQKYGAQPSSVFQQIELWARGVIGGGDVVNVPKHIFFDPDQRLLESHTLWLSERDLRNMIVRSLRRVNPNDAIMLARKMYHETWARCSSTSSAARGSALADLALLTTCGDELAAALFSSVDADHFPIESVLSALSDLGPGIHDPYEVLRPFLLHRNPLIARKAMSAFCQGAPESKKDEALTLLRAPLDAAARRELLKYLGVKKEGRNLDFSLAREASYGHEVAIELAKQGAKDGINEVIHLLSADDETVRNECAFAAAALHGDACLSALIKKLQEGGQPAAVFARALGRMKDSRAAPFLMLATKDSSWMLREEAAIALGILRVPSTLEHVQNLLDDEEISVRIAAAQALWNMGSDEGLSVLVHAMDHRFYRNQVASILALAYQDSAPITRSMWQEWVDRRRQQDR